MTLERIIRENLNETYSVAKMEQLVRLGLLPLKILPVLKRALKRLGSGSMLNPEDRHALAMLVDKILYLSLDDSATFNRMRTAVTQHRITQMEQQNNLINDLAKDVDGLNHNLNSLTKDIAENFAKEIWLKYKPRSTQNYF